MHYLRNKIYAFFAPFSCLHRYLISLIFIIAIVISWFFLLYFPLKKNIGNYKLKISEFYQNIRLKEAVKHELVGLEKEKNNLAKDIEMYVQIHAKKSYFDDCLAYLFSSATINKLYIDSYSTEKLTNKKWYTKQHIQFSFSGTLENINNFFSTIQASKKMIKTERIEINNKEKNNYSVLAEFSFIMVLQNPLQLGTS